MKRKLKSIVAAGHRTVGHRAASVLVCALCAVGLFGAGTAGAAGTINLGEVTSHDPWDGMFDVEYAVSGTDASKMYKVAIDLTANGQTAYVTNSPTKLAAGTYTNTYDTAQIFGAKTKDEAAQVKIRLIEFTRDPAKEVQLWDGGPIWAPCNIGATNPEDPGYYFYWGDIIGYYHNGNAWKAVGQSSGIEFTSDNAIAKVFWDWSNEDLKTYNVIDDNGNLTCSAENGYDAAPWFLGSPWRMPTEAELKALVNNCQWTWVDDYDGTKVSGYVVKGKKDSGYENNEIFLPAAGRGQDSDLDGFGEHGYYWSSTARPKEMTTVDPKVSPFLHIWKDSNGRFVGQCPRFKGCSVRPVKTAAPSPN